MRPPHYFIILVLCSVTGWAQPHEQALNRLKAQVFQASNDQERLALYSAITEKYFALDQYDSLYTYTKRGLQLVDTKHFPHYTGDFHYYQARYDRYLGSYSKALVSIRQGIAYAKTARDSRKTVEYQYTLAMLYADAGDLFRAADQIEQNIAYLATHPDPPTLAANYLLIIELARELNNHSLEELYTRQYLSLNKDHWPAVDLMYAAIFDGECLEKKGQFQLAEPAYRKGVAYARETHSPLRIMDAQSALASNLRSQRKYRAAQQLFSDQAYWARTLKIRALEAITKRNLALTLLEMNQIKEALREAKQALILARQNRQLHGIIASLKILSQILKANGDYQQALIIQQEGWDLREQLLSETNAQQVAYLQTMFEVESKEKTIRHLQKNAQVDRLNSLHQEQELTLARHVQEAAILIIILLITLVGTVLYFLRRSRRDYVALTQQQALLHQTAQELTETNRIKDKLFSVIGHDLRSPLSSMNYMIDEFRDYQKQPDKLDLLVDRMGRQMQNIMGLITNLLDWSKIQLTGLPTSPEPTLLHPIVEEVISEAMEQIRQKQLTVIQQVDVSHAGMSNTHQLRIILRNLISNAIKFTPVGGYLRISSVVQDAVTEIQIRDSGIGMSSEQIEALTEWPEVRSGTMGEQGLGLGLRICRDMLTQQGGTLRIESVPNRGTTVRIQLSAIPAYATL